MARTVTIHVRLADLPPFADLIRTTSTLIAALIEPTFPFDTLSPAAQLAMRSMSRSLRAIGGDQLLQVTADLSADDLAGAVEDAILRRSVKEA
jgi:hypothetical protein